MSGETDFPHVVANHKGHTLTIERSNGLPPHPSPPGNLEVWLRRPDLPDGKPGGHLVSQNICVFAATFDADEEITETQAERNALKGQLAESVKTERALHKEIGKLKARVAELGRTSPETANRSGPNSRRYRSLCLNASCRTEVTDGKH